MNVQDQLKTIEVSALISCIASICHVYMKFPLKIKDSTSFGKHLHCATIWIRLNTEYDHIREHELKFTNINNTFKMAGEI
jgi:hypothetical protein